MQEIGESGSYPSALRWIDNRGFKCTYGEHTFRLTVYELNDEALYSEVRANIHIGINVSFLPIMEALLTISRHGTLKNGNFIATKNTRKATGICLSLFCIVISDLFIGKSKVV